MVTSESSQPTEQFPWGRITWLVSGTIAPGTSTTFGVVTIEPGQSNPVHLHPNCEEILYVVSGECDHSLGEEWVHLKPGDAIRVPPNVRHNAVNRGAAPLKCVVAYSAPDRRTQSA